jgi:hypothetical protein
VILRLQLRAARPNLGLRRGRQLLNAWHPGRAHHGPLRVRGLVGRRGDRGLGQGRLELVGRAGRAGAGASTTSSRATGIGAGSAATGAGASTGRGATGSGGGALGRKAGTEWVARARASARRRSATSEMRCSVADRSGLAVIRAWSMPVATTETRMIPPDSRRRSRPG